MAEKKRKRNDQGGERPTKKAAFAPQTKIKVELLKNDEALGPLLGTQPWIDITTLLCHANSSSDNTRPQIPSPHLPPAV
jgi:hypothetical protein